YNEQVNGPAHVHNALDEPIRTALGRRDVAHLNIPKDLQSQTCSENGRSKANIPHHSGDRPAPPAVLPAQDELRAAADIINRGKKVAILAGRGALDARDLVLELAEKVGGPVIKALLGKGVLPDDSPYTTGGLGLLGTATSQDAMRGCDTPGVLGSSFPY